MLSTLFKNQKKVLVETASWLVKHGEPEAAKKVMFEVIKENPNDKSIRADYALMVRQIKEQKYSEEESIADTKQNQVQPS